MNAVSRALIWGMITSIFCSGCATNIKEKVLRNSLIATAAGAAYGNSKDEYKTQHSIMYGASAGLIAALVSVYYYDPDKRLDESRKQTSELAKSLDDFSEGNSTQSRRRPVLSGSATRNYGSLPDKYKSLVSPGEWVLREIDEYERIDDNKIVHKDQLFELIPAQINER